MPLTHYLWEAYREHVFTYLDPQLLSGERRIKAAVDASNGMAGTMVPKLFSDIPGVELIEINFENDKLFYLIRFLVGCHVNTIFLLL